MSTIVSVRCARTAALIAASLIALGCSQGGTVTAPPLTTPASPVSPVSSGASNAPLTLNGPRLSGYALASGRITDSLPAPTGK